jgi:tetratricopeptide (TPR) repeat protein
MKFFAIIAIALFLALPALRAQQSPDDQYVIIYVLIQQGDASLNSGQPQQALQDYLEAQRELQKFSQVYSDWNPKIVNFRMNYLADKITALTPQVPATNAPAAAPIPTPTPADWQAQLASLNGQIQHLEGNNETLTAKLKEALSAQPATVSADAYVQMQEQVRQLTKENDLLKSTVAQATNAVANAPMPSPATPDNSQLQQALQKEQLALAQANARVTQLAQEDDALEARILTLTTDADAAEALRQENALLKKELANLHSAPVVMGDKNLTAAQAQIAQLQADATADWLEKAGLENRVRQWQQAALTPAMGGTTAGGADLQSQVDALTSERNSLLVKLGEANKELSSRPTQDMSAQVDALARQVEMLRARVAMDEAGPVPYTSQELALFSPEPLVPELNVAKKSKLHGNSAILVAEAQNYATNQEYDKAAADYQEVLQHDPKNPLALANLAAVELELNQNADADKHIQAAISQEPNDAFNLTVLGRVKFSEGDYDGALNALTRAAELDPKNPQIQNFLGVALAQKGLRTQAETALRKAVQMEPDYGDAHKNLAIIYLSANPPLVELARWHYEKALAAGVPPNADLEKMLKPGGSGALQ